MTNRVSGASVRKETQHKPSQKQVSQAQDFKPIEGEKTTGFQDYLSGDSNPSETIPALLNDPRLPKAQRQAIASASESLSGNLAFQRLIIPKGQPKETKDIPSDTGVIMRQEKPATDFRQELLNLNIKEEEIGTPGTVENPQHYLDMLKLLLSKHKGIADILIRRWNNCSDDLGISKQKKHYGSILHYLKELDRLSMASLKVPWEEAIAKLSSPKQQISLAGARFTVHPRALYFTAAAQVGMDIAAKIKAGQGHYIAPGALYSEVYSIFNAASTVVKMSVISPGGEKPGDVLPMPNAAALYNNIRKRLDYINQVVSAQMAATPTGTSAGTAHTPLTKYHYEQALIDFFKNKGELKALPMAASSNADAVLLCQKITGILKLEQAEVKPKKGQKKKVTPPAPGEFLPKKVSGHGTWSFDPHSTSHALAVAIDLFTDRVRAITNMGARPSVVPFINYLIRNFGHEYKLDPKKGYTGMSMKIAQLLHEHGIQTLEQIDKDTKGVKQRELNKTIYLFDTQKAKLKNALQKRAQLIGKVLRNKKWRAPGEYKAHLSILKNLLSSKEINRLLKSSPDELVKRVKHINGLLDDIHNAFPSPEAGVELTGASKTVFDQIQAASPATEPNLINLEETLSKLQKPASSAQFKLQQLKLKSTLSPGVKNWVKTVSSLTSSAFDQPSELMAGITGVKGARMMGPHHWEIGAYNVPKGEFKPGMKKSYEFRDLLTSDKGYEDLLLLDMNTRQPKDMERILKTMCETPGGRQAIFGEGADIPFRQALTQWATTKKVNLDELLTKVVSVEPTKKRRNPQITKLIQDLYDRGYYELAKQIEGPPSISLEEGKK